MAQFIIVTDAHGAKNRVNVDNIATYLPVATDGGCEATIMLVNKFTLEVQEDAEAIDRLIRNTDKRSVLANDLIRP